MKAHGSARWRPRPSGPRDHGVSLLELVFVLGVALTVGLLASPGLMTGLDDYRARGAARYVAGRLQLARATAVARSANTAIRFVPVRGSYIFTMYVDGDRDGVSASDVASGVDPAVGPAEALFERFAGADFALVPGVPGPDGTPMTGSHPVRFGPTDMVSFTPAGTATPGSVYIRGRLGAQYVVRVYGDTGKTQLLKYLTGRRAWTSA